jgi:hypothetical protein
VTGFQFDELDPVPGFNAQSEGVTNSVC